MQEIADRAGVNKALLHYHFRSKADLARAVWLRIASCFVPGIFQMMASDISLDEKIDRFVDAYHTRLRAFQGGGNRQCGPAGLCRHGRLNADHLGDPCEPVL
jgi:AcrR family transcriptional regulator